jgi:hypothetical protein
MARIHLGFERFADDSNLRRTRAMRHENTVFASLLKHVPQGKFDQLVKKHGMDHGVRGLTTRAQFCAMLYAQLSGASSLRDLETRIAAHKSVLYHAGIKDGVRRSTLADANRTRSHAFFDDLFALLLRELPVGLPRKMRQTVRLLDSTRIRLSSLSSAWACYSKDVFGTKIHVVYDLGQARPVYFVTTPANITDLTPVKAIPIDPNATYVFDLAYYDYAWWAAMDAQGSRIVTRFRANTPLCNAKECEVPRGQDHILSDRIGHLPARLGYLRRNPMKDPVREVTIRIDTGKILRLLTNDLDAPAKEIAELYKSRWQIELFFRWIKQTLKIKHFMGTTENAVRIQVAVAMIAFLLLRTANDLYGRAFSALTFARLIRTALDQRRPINRLLDPPKPSQNKDQMLLDFATC